MGLKQTQVVKCYLQFEKYEGIYEKLTGTLIKLPFSPFAGNRKPDWHESLLLQLLGRKVKHYGKRCSNTLTKPNPPPHATAKPTPNCQNSCEECIILKW